MTLKELILKRAEFYDRSTESEVATWSAPDQACLYGERLENARLMREVIEPMVEFIQSYEAEVEGMDGCQCLACVGLDRLKAKLKGEG